MKKPQAGFTIVELLIVIVVIAILATISIVAYNGVQDRARASVMTSALTQAGKKMALWRVDNPDQYPTSLVALGVSDTDVLTYQYTYDTSMQTYCIMATHANGVSYYISSTSGSVQSGTCSNYNLVAWNKVAGTGAPISGSSVTVDTSTYRSSIASLQLAPGSTLKYLRGGPFTGTTGQKYTVTLWIKTDLSWDGTLNNSKIRFGNASSGDALLASCAYNGVKASWTQVNCSYTFSAGVTSVNISLRNDGTVGNIWFDDISLTLT